LEGEVHAMTLFLQNINGDETKTAADRYLNMEEKTRNVKQFCTKISPDNQPSQHLSTQVSESLL
jgi:hypothetical protein